MLELFGCPSHYLVVLQTPRKIYIKKGLKAYFKFIKCFDIPLPASKRVRRPTACHFIPQSEWDIPLTASKWVRRPTACITWHLIPQWVRYPSASITCDLIHHDQSEWDTGTLYPATSYLRLNEYSGNYLWPHTSKWVRHSITCYLISQWVWDIPLPATSYLSEWDTITCHLVPKWVWDFK